MPDVSWASARRIDTPSARKVKVGWLTHRTDVRSYRDHALSSMALHRPPDRGATPRRSGPMDDPMLDPTVATALPNLPEVHRSGRCNRPGRSAAAATTVARCIGC